MKNAIYILFIAAIVTSCATIQNGKPSIQQGVFGRVSWTEGNQMPSIGTTNKTGNTPVSRTIKIYELTSNTQVEGQAPLFSSVKSKLIATVKSDTAGYFQHRLAPGRYSIFTVEEDGKLFASLGDSDGSIAPFEIKANEVTTYNINVNYKAAY